MEPQGLREELMRREHALDPTVINGIGVAVADDPRQFPRGEGVHEGQPHDVLPQVSGYEGLHRRPPPGVAQGAPIDQAQEAMALKAPEITPQSPIVDPGLLALLAERPLTRQHRTEGLIAGEGCRRRHGVTDEQGQLRGMGCKARQNFRDRYGWLN